MIRRSLRLGVAVALMLAGSAAVAQAEEVACAPPGKAGADGLAELLAEQPDCKAAIAKLRDCAWGSSADTRFSAIAVGICEKAFMPKLSPAERQGYGERMQLCAYRYARQQGTVYISAAALCQADVAARVAADPKAAATRPGPASFDCGRARTGLERTICADPALGRADLVLADVFRDVRASLDRDQTPKEPVVADQKAWLESLPGRCGLTTAPASPTMRDCLRERFELRVAALVNCLDAGITVDCLKEEPELRSGLGAARASFDCGAPSTAVEIAICADARLGEADVALAAAYRAALSGLSGAVLAELKASQRRWLAFVEGRCPLGVVGGIPPVLGRACIRSAFELRTAQLGACRREPQARWAECLGAFRIVAEPAGPAAPGRPRAD